jgi:hypothetical protein
LAHSRHFAPRSFAAIIPRPSLRSISLAPAALVSLLVATVSAQASASIPGFSPLTTIANVKVSNDSYLAHSEPAIAENPRNPKNLIAGSKMFTNPAKYEFKIGTYYSVNGGKSWHDDGFLPGFDAYDQTSDISMTFDAKGRAYACVLAVSSSGASGIFVSESADGGRTWGQPSTVFLDPTGATFTDKPWIVVDRSSSPYRGNIYVAWNLDDTSASNLDPDAGGISVRPTSPLAATTPETTPAVQTGLVVARSSDGGKTWSAPVTLLPFDAYSSRFALGAIPQVDPKGGLHVVYLKWDQSASGTTTSMEMRSSTDGGATFTKAQSIVPHVDNLPNLLKNGNFRNLSLPTFAVSSRDGSMAVAWADIRNGDADVLLSRSSDGSTWSKPYRVNHDALTNGKDQFQPELAVAPNGVYTCAWFDRRHDPNNRLINEEIAQSSDGARTFGHNFPVTKKMWDPAIDAPHPEGDPKTTFIGDYQALAVDNRTVHPLWNDTQNGSTQEIRTAVISVSLFDRRK